ncbi:MAG: Fic family protein [Gammaproteobacteria bacterium]
MALQPIGYSYLVGEYGLPVRPLPICAVIDSGVRGRESRRQGNQQIFVFQPNYRPKDSLAGHLQFALRYEGVNLKVLALLFQQSGKADLEQWLTDKSTSAYARRAGYLYEWLTGGRLAEEAVSGIPERANYVRLLDPELQFEAPDGERDSRFRIINNLTGNRDFCPLVRRTPYLQESIERDLRTRIHETLARYDEDLLRRAAGYLYLKETQSSFEVEREKPSPNRAQRFADLLRQADTGEPLTEKRLAELQQAVIDPRFHEFTWRSQQNWIGRDHGYRKQVDFVPPRPEDVPDLMAGLLSLAERARAWPTSGEKRQRNKGKENTEAADPVIAAAIIAFGFVFIHPFMDGNGRIHRYLIHDVLANAGFTPRGIILPVSAVILAHLRDYVQVLEAFSRPLLARTDYDPDTPKVPARGNDALYFRYFDATEQAEYLYRALERTVEEDLQREIDFLLGFDRAYRALNGLLDWPGHSLDLFIRLVYQNEGKLSRTKREKHFDWMTDDEISEAEEMVVQAFDIRSNKTEQPNRETS